MNNKEVINRNIKINDINIKIKSIFDANKKEKLNEILFNIVSLKLKEKSA